jgi:Protein of unknown function (DUF4199)
LKFGLISGAIMATLMFVTIPFADKIGFDKGMIVGFTSMILAFLLIFFGVRSYRENVSNGEISFPAALGVGVLIMLVGTLCYVVAWEIVYFNFMPDFFEKYSAYLITQMKSSGASAESVEAQRQALALMGQRYRNPFWNAAYTFLEPMPVGIPITVLSAIILRRKPKSLKGSEQLVSS